MNFWVLLEQEFSLAIRPSALQTVSILAGIGKFSKTALAKSNETRLDLSSFEGTDSLMCS